MSIKSFRIAMIGTIPTLDKFSDYATFIGNLKSSTSLKGLDGEAIARKYEEWDFESLVRHSSGHRITFLLEKESILPKVFRSFGSDIALGNCVIEYVLNKRFFVGSSIVIPDSPHVHDFDLNERIRPELFDDLFDIVYIDNDTLMYIDRYNELRGYDLIAKLYDDFMAIMKPHALLVIDDPKALFGETSKKIYPPVNHAIIQLNGTHARTITKVWTIKKRPDIATSLYVETAGKNESETKFLKCCRYYDNKRCFGYTLVLRRSTDSA